MTACVPSSNSIICSNTLTGGLPTGRFAYKRKQGKARRIIYDSVKETVMPNITALKTVKECYDALVNLYEKKAPSQKRVLKKRLRTLTRMKVSVLSLQRFHR